MGGVIGMKEPMTFGEVRRLVMYDLEKCAKAVKQSQSLGELRDIVAKLPFSIHYSFYVAPYTYNFQHMEVHHDERGRLQDDKVPSHCLMFMKGVVLGFIASFDRLFTLAHDWRELL